jgi:hypothetical protein
VGWDADKHKRLSQSPEWMLMTKSVQVLLISLFNWAICPILASEEEREGEHCLLVSTVSVPYPCATLLELCPGVWLPQDLPAQKLEKARKCHLV